jgi:hypothetical protein
MILALAMRSGEKGAVLRPFVWARGMSEQTYQRWRKYEEEVGPIDPTAAIVEQLAEVAAAVFAAAGAEVTAEAFLPWWLKGR